MSGGGPAEPPTRAGARAGYWIARALIRSLWSVRVRGAEHVPADGAVILAPNHAGFVDGPLLMSAAPRPLHALVKKELFRGPISWILRGVGQISVDRDDPSRAALASARAVLDDGRVLVVFPEGTRGEGDFSELRTGLAWFALRSSAPVVPVVITGTGSRGTTLGGLPGLRSRLEVVFGAPVTIPQGGARTRSALDATTARLREALVAHRSAVLGERAERDIEGRQGEP